MKKNHTGNTKSSFSNKHILNGIIACTMLCGCEMFSIISSPAQERGVSGFFDDNVLRIKINAELAKGDGLEQVEIMIHKGKVVLLGIVRRPDIKQRAFSLIKNIDGVKQVIDEIKVGSEGLADYSRDAYFGHKLRALLFFDARINSQNYHVRVVDKIVYILGTAQSQYELDCVIQQAESLPVRRVIVHVEIAPTVTSTNVTPKVPPQPENH